MERACFNDLKLTLLALLLVGTMPAYGQATRRIERQHPIEANIEQYYVLVADSNVKHGPYRMIYFFGGEPMQVGYYKLGKKDSLWKEYCAWDNFIQARGKYHNNQRVGEWEFFKKRNVLEQKYDYTRHTVTYFTFDSGARKMMVDNGKLVPTELDRPAMYIGGKLSVMGFVMEHLKYPEKEFKAGVHGTVEVAVEVDKQGKVKRVWPYKKIQKKLDEAAVGVIKKLPAQWIPALYKGKPVSSVFFIEIPFILQ